MDLAQVGLAPRDYHRRMNAPGDPGAKLPADATRLLNAARVGDESAIRDVFRSWNGTFRRLALRAMGNGSLRDRWQPTMFVDDTFVALLSPRRTPWRGRREFFALAARCIHDAIVDFRRSEGAARRGGAFRREALRDQHPSRGRDVDLALDVEGALGRLSTLRPRLAEIVRLRHLEGLSIAETASRLGIGHATVEVEWRLARTLLHEMLEADAAQ